MLEEEQVRVGRHTNADGGVRVLRGEPDGEVRKSSQHVRGVVGTCTPLWRTPCVPSVQGGRDCRTDQPPGYAGRLPDAEVRAAGVVAPDRGHSAGVRADVARPGLGDVKGAVGIRAHAWDRLDIDGGSLLLPDVPERETMQAHSGCD